MNKYNLTSLVALFILALAFPAYALFEQNRLDHARADLRQEYLEAGSILYVDNCARCHGGAGEGRGVIPPLDSRLLAESNVEFLEKTIERGRHGTLMAAWHVSEAGDFNSNRVAELNDYQVAELVTLIRFGEWDTVRQLAEVRNMVPASLPVPVLEESYVEESDELDPHACVSCHREPTIHHNRFGLDCARCHSVTAWAPALLLQHTFALDHGGEGRLACQNCHTHTYADHSCYECHDHTPQDTADWHIAEGIADYEDCVACHPTGISGEAGARLELEGP